MINCNNRSEIHEIGKVQKNTLNDKINLTGNGEPEDGFTKLTYKKRERKQKKEKLYERLVGIQGDK